VHSTTAGQRYRRCHHGRPFGGPEGGRSVACAVCRKEHGGWDSVSGGFTGGAGGGGAV
jgi:hypothetical protein